jgi:hypothetical protein
MGWSCDYIRTTKEQIKEYAKGLDQNKVELVGITGSWIKYIRKESNTPCALILLMHKDAKGYVLYKAVNASAGPNELNQGVARWIKKEYEARGLTPDGELKEWLDRCDKAKAEADRIKAFGDSLVVGQRYPVKRDFEAGPYKFKAGEEFIYWGATPRCTKRRSFHFDGIPVNFRLHLDLFMEDNMKK